MDSVTTLYLVCVAYYHKFERTDIQITPIVSSFSYYDGLDFIIVDNGANRTFAFPEFSGENIESFKQYLISMVASLCKRDILFVIALGALWNKHLMH